MASRYIKIECQVTWEREERSIKWQVCLGTCKSKKAKQTCQPSQQQHGDTLTKIGNPPLVAYLRRHVKHEQTFPYTNRPSHPETFTPTSSYNTKRLVQQQQQEQGFYTKMCLHQQASVRTYTTILFVRQRAFTPRSFYTRKLVHQQSLSLTPTWVAFLHKQAILQAPFGPQPLGHWIKGRRNSRRLSKIS